MGDFEIQIGGETANILTINSLTGKHFLEVMPPVQAANGSYDLVVRIGSQEDTEANAIIYDDVTGVDVVLVLDRSGSMGTYGYMEPAKEAAEQFILHMHVSSQKSGVN
jgi:hypothetical protein